MSLIERVQPKLLIARQVLTGKAATVPLDRIVDWHGFNFGASGWHYLVSLFREVLDNPEVHLEDTSAFRFFASEKIRAVRYMTDLLFLHDQSVATRAREARLHYGVFPWGYFTAQYPRGRPHGKWFDVETGSDTRPLCVDPGSHLWYEPGNAEGLRRVFEKVKGMAARVTSGVVPMSMTWRPILVSRLVDLSGAVRYVRLDGKHRLALYSALGWNQARVTIHPYAVDIREQDADSWRLVRSGQCPVDLALRIFRTYFELDGREKASAVGLRRPPHGGGYDAER